MGGVQVAAALAGVAVLAAGDPPSAQPSAVEPAPATGARATEAALVYRPEFFARSRPNTALDMVNRLPGFSFSGGQSARGFAGTAGNVLVDGQRPAAKSESLSEIIARIPASAVERIELIRGGAPGIDMQGLTVIANVVRRSSTEAQHALSASTTISRDGRNIPTLRYELTRQSGERALDAQATITGGLDDGSGSGPRTRFDAERNVTERAFVESNGTSHIYEAKAGYRSPLAGGKLGTNATVRRTTYEFDQEVRRPALTEVTDLISDGWNAEAGLNFDRRFGSKMSLQTVVLQRYNEDETTSRQDLGSRRVRFSEDSVSGESIARSVLRFDWSETFSMEAGGEGAFNFLDSQTEFEVNGAPMELPSANVRVEERRGEAFTQVTWRPTPKLSVEVGSRFEVSTISETGDVELKRSFYYPKPRTLLTWSPDSSNQLRFRIERVVGQLDFGDFVSSAELQNETIEAGNPELEPEKTWVVEAACERRFWEKGAIVLTGRHLEITDVLDLVPVIGPDFAFDAPGNIGDGRSDEVQLAVTLPLDRLGLANGLLKTDGTWRISEVVDPTTGQMRRISNQRPYEVSIGFTQDLPRLKSTWGFDAQVGFEQTSYRLSEIRRVEVTPLLGFFAEYKPTPKYSVRLQLSNVTRFKVVQQRTLYAGARADGMIASYEERPLTSDFKGQLRFRRVFG